MHFSSMAKDEVILTAIFTMLVSARTRVMSKKVNRFLLVGRVVRKKLTRATQQKLEAVKESRQRSNFTTAAIFFGPIFVFNQGTEVRPQKKVRGYFGIFSQFPKPKKMCP